MGQDRESTAHGRLVLRKTASASGYTIPVGRSALPRVPLHHRICASESERSERPPSRGPTRPPGASSSKSLATYARSGGSESGVVRHNHRPSRPQLFPGRAGRERLAREAINMALMRGQGLATGARQSSHAQRLREREAESSGRPTLPRGDRRARASSGQQRRDRCCSTQGARGCAG
jgi:hypothetical protein